MRFAIAFLKDRLKAKKATLLYVAFSDEPKNQKRKFMQRIDPGSRRCFYRMLIQPGKEQLYL